MNLFENLQMCREFADGRADIKNKLRNSEEQRIQNLMMIYIWKDKITVTHWTSELFGVCHNISKTKKNKFPKYDFILQNIWRCWEDCYYDWFPGLIDITEWKEHRKVPDFSKDDLYSFMKEYHEWLAERLSIKGFITFNDVKSIITKLLNKY